MLLIDQFPVIIVAGSALSAFTILLAGWFNRKSCFFISLSTIVFQFVLSLFVLHHVLTVGVIHYWIGGWRPPWGIEYLVDGLSAYVLVIVLFMSLMSVIYAKRTVERQIAEKKHVTFYALFQLLVTGLVGVVVTGDMFNMYVLLEVCSLAAYALIAVAGGRALRASYNYLVIGSIGICFYLLGIAFLYSVTGTLNMADMRLLLPPLYGSKAVQTAFVFILIGLGIKMAFFPLHTWQPDAYTYAPSAVSVIISTAMAKASIYALIRVVFSVFTVNFIFQYMWMWTFISWLAAFTIIIGSVYAIAQWTLKRMLAYSSISQIGYIVLGMTLLGSHWGLEGGLMHLLNHCLMKGALFMAACAIIYKAGLWDIRDFEGLAKRMPYTSAAFLLAALSMIGIPPSVGFVTKVYLILGSLDAGQLVFVIVILASSLLNLVYFWRVIETMYMKGGKGVPEQKRDEAPLSILIPTVVLASLSIIVGILWLIGTPLPILKAAVSAMGVLGQ